MNVFDMIFRNSGTREVIFSSIYNYLMDRNETHGLKDQVLSRVIGAIPDDKVHLAQKYQSFDREIVEAEYSLGEVGQIDSRIELSTNAGDAVSCLYTEVKILDGSALNETRYGRQIERYMEEIAKRKDEDSLLIYLVPGPESVMAVAEVEAYLKSCSPDIASRIFLMFWRSGDTTKLSVPETNICRKSFESILQELLLDDMKGLIPPVSTEVRYVLRSLSNTIQNNFYREERYDPGRFPNRREFLSRIPDIHARLFEYLESKTGSKRSISRSNTSIGFPYSKAPEGRPNTLLRVLTMVNYRRLESEIFETDYADHLIIQISEKVWKLDDAMKNRLAEMFSGVADVHFHQFHPNGKNNEPSTWISFREDLKEDDLPDITLVIDSFWELAEAQFANWLEDH